MQSTNNPKNFNGTTGEFNRANLSGTDWYQKITQYNATQREPAIDVQTIQVPIYGSAGNVIGYDKRYEVYVDGQLNPAAGKKLIELENKEGLKFVSGLLGITDFIEAISGKDPFTGKKITSQERAKAIFWTVLIAVPVGKTVTALKDLRKGAVLEKTVLKSVDEESLAGVDKAGGADKIMSNADAEKYAFDATKGTNNSDSIVLGKFDGGGPTAYTTKAKEVEAQYFELDNWDELSKMYSDKEIWKINEKFLDIQIGSGRDIYFSHNPLDYIDDGSFYSQEIAYLQNHGFGFEKIGDLWHVIR